MFNWNEFDKIFNEMFSFKSGINLNDKNWEKKTYKTQDGTYSITYFTKNNSKNSNFNEIELLKNKLEIAIEDQDFESAVELRDKIKNLEDNQEKISELQLKLDECVKNQDFEGAIEYRDQIKSLK
jgi:protein-arginine kinase activator protein McsA